MLNCEAEVRETLAQPDEIRRSKSDRDVYLFYRARNQKRWVCAVIAVAKIIGTYLMTDYLAW
jgi:hypothetical protein